MAKKAKLPPKLASLRQWMEKVGGEEWSIFAKLLSPNDTGQTQSNQSGVYLTKDVVLLLFPQLAEDLRRVPDCILPTIYASHPDAAAVDARYLVYKSKPEGRVTQLNGTASPLLQPDNTNSIVLFAFHQSAGVTDRVEIWLASTGEEQEWLEEEYPVLELGGQLFLWHRRIDQDLTIMIPKIFEPRRAKRERTKRITRDELPQEWLEEALPSGEELVRWVVAKEKLENPDGSPDERLLRRRQMEFQAFRILEEEVVFPRVRRGFATLQQFIRYANSVTNRRKSRSGTSLELHLRQIFADERVQFEAQQLTEGRKRPDFLLPSKAAYDSTTFPAANLRMLGVKTTCKDRWRQVLNEAARIPSKHLFTLQESVSEAQYHEMAAAGLTLVVPKPLHAAYPASVQPKLLSLADFIAQVRALHGTPQ